MALFPFSIDDITDPEHIRVVLYASGRMGHAPLNALVKQIQKDITQISQRLDILEQKLKTIDPGNANHQQNTEGKDPGSGYDSDFDIVTNQGLVTVEGGDIGSGESLVTVEEIDIESGESLITVEEIDRGSGETLVTVEEGDGGSGESLITVEGGDGGSGESLITVEGGDGRSGESLITVEEIDRGSGETLVTVEGDDRGSGEANKFDVENIITTNFDDGMITISDGSCKVKGSKESI